MSQVDLMTPELYERFKQAIATGRWMDGNQVSTEQKETLMQAILLWEDKINMQVGDKTGTMHDQCKSDTPKSNSQKIELVQDDG